MPLTEGKQHRDKGTNLGITTDPARNRGILNTLLSFQTLHSLECRVNAEFLNSTTPPFTPHLRLKCVVDASIPGRLVRQRLIASADPRRYAGEGQVKHSRGSNQPLLLPKVNNFW